jgi:adenine-specific DNA-methyltransferase
MPAPKLFLKDVKAGIVPQTLWKYEDVGQTQEAEKEMIAAVRFDDTESVLNTVTPVRFIERMLQIGASM